MILDNAIELLGLYFHLLLSSDVMMQHARMMCLKELPWI